MLERIYTCKELFFEEDQAMSRSSGEIEGLNANQASQGFHRHAMR